MPTAEQNSIPRSTADKLVAAHDGDVALLYIWLDLNGGFDADRAARELCRTEAEIKNAHEKLLRMGLSRPAARPEQEIKLPPAEELPEYTSADIVRRSKEDSGFQAVIAQAQHKLGRVLSTAELKTLFGIYSIIPVPLRNRKRQRPVSLMCSFGTYPSLIAASKETTGWCLTA